MSKIADIRCEGNGKADLAPSTFRQVSLGSFEFQELPGPEVRTLREKTIRHASLPRPVGQAVLSPRKRLFHCRGARQAPDRPAFKLQIVDCGMGIEKEESKNPKSAIRNSWADAFSAQSPYFQATTLFFRRKE